VQILLAIAHTPRPPLGMLGWGHIGCSVAVLESSGGVPWRRDGSAGRTGPRWPWECLSSAPLVYTVTMHPAAVYTAAGLGILIVLVSLWALAKPVLAFPLWINLILAVLLFISPWVNMAWSAWVLAALVYLAAGSVLGSNGGRLSRRVDA